MKRGVERKRKLIEVRTCDPRRERLFCAAGAGAQHRARRIYGFPGSECRIASTLRTGRKCDTAAATRFSAPVVVAGQPHNRDSEGSACHVQSGPGPSLSSAHGSPEFWEGEFPSVFTARQQIDEVSNTESRDQ